MGCGAPQTRRIAAYLPLLLLSICLPVISSSATQFKQPVSLVASPDWYGDDGQWGAVYLAIGDLSQKIAVLPNTVGVDVLGVSSGGCVNVSGTDCASKRGGLFEVDYWSDWQSDGYLQTNFNGIGVKPIFAQYGIASVFFDYGKNYLPSVFGPNTEVHNITTSVASFNDTNNWIGYIGLNAYRSDLSDVRVDTLMRYIWLDRLTAPSCSYGYTAGAYYRLKGAPASLTLGGVDELRFEPNEVSFNLSFQGLPVVSLSSIEVLSAHQNAKYAAPLLEASVDAYFTLDSSTSYLWLPPATCDMLSQTLNLTYNDTLGLYTYLDGAHDRLAEQAFSFTFTITDTSSSSSSVNITLPFAAFDHYISYPFPNYYPSTISEKLPYFPIKRAQNSDEYRIGRVFFQEAYLVVDYERGNFSVYQASFDSVILTNTSLVVIEPLPYFSYPSTPSNGLSKGALGGVIIGSVIGFAGLVWVFWRFCIRHRYQLSVRRRQLAEKGSNLDISSSQDLSIAPRRWKRWRYRGRAEVEGDNVQPSELPGNSIHELPGSFPVTSPPPPTSVRKHGVRQSTMSSAGSSVVSFSSSTPTSGTSDGSYDEEELVSSRPNSRPSSITKTRIPATE